MKTRLVIRGNEVYELDEACEAERKLKQKKGFRKTEAEKEVNRQVESKKNITNEPDCFNV